MPTTGQSSYAPCRPDRCRRVNRPRRKLGARLAALAIALVALVLMYHGERWLLERPQAVPDELAVATCALDVVRGDASASGACSGSLFQ